LRGRRLVLVDVENVVGGAVKTEAQAHWARQEVESKIGFRENDHIVIAAGRKGVFPSHAAWPTARIEIGLGLDGADLVLIEIMRSENIHQRFEEILLISGDGIFTDEVSKLGSLGARITVVAHEHGLSQRLKMSATNVKTFSKKYFELGEVA